MCSTRVSRGQWWLKALEQPNHMCVTFASMGYPRVMTVPAAEAFLSVAWSSVLLVRHASLKCSHFEHTSDSVEHTSED